MIQYIYMYICISTLNIHIHIFISYVYFAIQQYLHFACNIPLAVGRIFHYTTNKHIKPYKPCIDMFLVAKQFGPIVWNCPSSSKPTPSPIHKTAEAASPAEPSQGSVLKLFTDLCPGLNENKSGKI